MWERGLKRLAHDEIYIDEVAPHVGAWIETRMIHSTYLDNPVAPHVGAWIETCVYAGVLHRKQESLPMWERGLKRPNRAL